MYTNRDSAVYISSGNLFKNGSTLVGICLKKGSKTTLRQEHGAGKLIEVHTCNRFYMAGNVTKSCFNNISGDSICDFMFWGLKLPVWFFTGAMLTPVAAKNAVGRFKSDLCKAFTFLTRHDFITGFCNPVEPGSSSVKCKADRIKNGRFTGTGRSGYSEDTIG